METRFSKRTRDGEVEAQDTNENLAEVVEEIFDDRPPVEEENPVRPTKTKKKVKCSPRKLWSPTGALEVTRLKEQSKMDRQKIGHLEERIKYLEETNRELKNDKDFLLSQIKRQTLSPAPSTPGMSGPRKNAQVFSSSSPSPTPISDSSDPSLSSSSEEEKMKRKKRKQKKSKKHTDPHSRSRMTTIDGVVGRYKNALRSFTKCGSMKATFTKMNVDRNTIARTAVIAELAITFPDIFQELLPRDEDGEKISEFAERCRSAITTEMAETITAKKKKGKLLPIMHKYT